MMIYTTTGYHKYSFEEKFKILEYAMNRQGKSHDAIEERMQSANKNILIVQKERCPVEGGSAEDRLTASMRSLHLGARIGHGL